MKTQIENLATIFASAIWADGVFEDAERETVVEIAEAFELDPAELSSAVDKKIAELQNADDEKVSEALFAAGEKVDGEEIGEVFEAVLQILSSDGSLSHLEIANMLAVADALGISDENAILLLVDLIKDEPEIEVVLDEE